MTIAAILEAIMSATPPTVMDISRRLLSVALPLPLFFGEREPTARPGGADEQRPAPQPTVVVVRFWLDGEKIVVGQTVQSEILHDLQATVTVSNWPEEAEDLFLTCISVEPPSAYEMPTFRFTRPKGVPPFEITDKKRLLLHLPQAISARPLEFTYRAHFHPADGAPLLSVEGEKHLRFQSYDIERNPQSGYREVDRALCKMREVIRLQPGIGDREISDFLRIMTAIGRLAGQSLQDALFRGDYKEARFQSEVKAFLRSDPRIGSELEEHPRAAGGITDLSFRGVRIELKVSDDVHMNLDDASRYLEQVSQYVAGSDRRLGVLCVLDSSPKTTAPSPVGNDMGVRSVGTQERPAVQIGVVIVRGNLELPSELST
jgi:hypothetical protein